VIILLTILYSLFPQLEAAEAVKTKEDEVIQILFTHDGMGELEPCGCRGNPLGGVVRRATLTERLKKEVPLTFQVEVGNSFFENSVTPDSLKSVLGYQSEKIAESFRFFPVKYFVPGEKDFSLGLKHLKKLQALSKSTFLAANLTDQNGRHLFQKSAVDKTQKNKLLWVGLLGPDLTLPTGLKIKDPIETLRLILKNRPQSEKKIIIILSQLGMEKDQALAAKFPEISLILGSRDQAFTQTPIVSGKTIILQTSYRNQHLGRVKFPFGALSEENPLRIVSDFMPLEENLEKDAPEKALQLIREWKAGVEKRGQLSTALPKEFFRSGPQTFPQCTQCHEAAFHFWRKTGHANALHPLREKKLLTHPSCLACHTLSTDDPAVLLTDEKTLNWEENEFLMSEIVKAENRETPIRLTRESLPKPLSETLESLQHVRGSVQCENCHVSQGNHPFSGSIKKEVPDSTCLKCHTQERAPSWYEGKVLNQSLFAEKRKKVQCPRTEP
jgi:hypothetical protein